MCLTYRNFLVFTYYCGKHNWYILKRGWRVLQVFSYQIEVMEGLQKSINTYFIGISKKEKRNFVNTVIWNKLP